MKKITVFIAVVVFSTFAQVAPVSDLKVTILSTMIADYGKPKQPTIGEWGFSALVEVDGNAYFSTPGARRKRK